MVAVANAVPAMSAVGEERLKRAMETIAGDRDGADLDQLIAKRDELLALA